VLSPRLTFLVCGVCVFCLAHTKTANDYFSANLTHRKIKKHSAVKGYISSILVSRIEVGCVENGGLFYFV
jgi:hypothetical protein